MTISQNDLLTAEKTANYYLSRYEMVFQVIITDDNPLLITFGNPIYEIIHIGIVSALEGYLHDRLENIILKNRKNRDIYCQKYNYRRDRVHQIKPSDITAIINSLDHCYHNIGILQKYFNPFHLEIAPLFYKHNLDGIIDCRNFLCHNPPRGFIGKQTVYLTISELRTTINAVKSFISDFEVHCMIEGYDSIFISPDE